MPIRALSALVIPVRMRLQSYSLHSAAEALVVTISIASQIGTSTQSTSRVLGKLTQ